MYSVTLFHVLRSIYLFTYVPRKVAGYVLVALFRYEPTYNILLAVHVDDRGVSSFSFFLLQ